MKIIEEETKKAGLLLAGIGVLLTILFNLLLTQQALFSKNSTIEKPPIPSIIDPALFSFFFDYHLIIGEALLLLVSAVCLIGVLVNSSRVKEKWSSVEYQDWLNRSILSYEVADFQKELIKTNRKSIVDFDESITNLNGWYNKGVLSFLFALGYMIIILILILVVTSSDVFLFQVILFAGSASIAYTIYMLVKHVVSWSNSRRIGKKGKVNPEGVTDSHHIQNQE